MRWIRLANLGGTGPETAVWFLACSSSPLSCVVPMEIETTCSSLHGCPPEEPPLRDRRRSSNLAIRPLCSTLSSSALHMGQCITVSPRPLSGAVTFGCENQPPHSGHVWGPNRAHLPSDSDRMSSGLRLYLEVQYSESLSPRKVLKLASVKSIVSSFSFSSPSLFIIDVLMWNALTLARGSSTFSVSAASTISCAKSFTTFKGCSLILSSTTST